MRFCIESKKEHTNGVTVPFEAKQGSPRRDTIAWHLYDLSHFCHEPLPTCCPEPAKRIAVLTFSQTRCCLP